MTSRVILVLIDGLSTTFFAQNRAQLPHLDVLAQTGVLTTHVRPPVPGTSRPSRATLLTGRPTAEHGIYGNAIRDGARFRPATPEDIALPTLARQARDAGRTVASLGFGMVRSEDCHDHLDPWRLHLPTGGMTTLKGPVAAEQPAPQLPATLAGLISDQQLLSLATDRACSDHPPDLILTEFCTTDMIAHRHGLDSAVTRWAFMEADMAIGRLVHRLEHAGRLRDTTVVICSDHGHGGIHTALYPSRMLAADRLWASEGGTLHVRITDPADRASVTGTLAAYGIRPLPDDHLPVAERGRIASFVAPRGAGFEPAPDGPPGLETGSGASGTPTILSTHGLDPADPADRAIVLVLGPGQESARIDSLADIAPVVLTALGL